MFLAALCSLPLFVYPAVFQNGNATLPSRHNTNLVEDLDLILTIDSKLQPEKLRSFQKLVRETIPRKGRKILPHLLDKVRRTTDGRVIRHALESIAIIEGLDKTEFEYLLGSVREQYLGWGNLDISPEVTKKLVAFVEGFLDGRRMVMFMKTLDSGSAEILVDTSRIEEAQRTCLALASAISQFHKDVGAWPAGPGNRDYHVKRLVSGSNIPQITAKSRGMDFGFKSNANDDWFDAGLTQQEEMPQVDTFAHFLSSNHWAYPLKTEESLFGWKGPYLEHIQHDPWGRPYICNIESAYEGKNRSCVVLSAGPNGIIDSPINPDSLARPKGDDLWAVVHVRP